jgi:hypothetical protein
MARWTVLKQEQERLPPDDVATCQAIVASWEYWLEGLL